MIQQLIKNNYAEKHNINNEPDEDQRKNLQYLIDMVLAPLFEYYNNKIFISLGFIGKQLNEILGEENNSLHLLGAAVDIDSNVIPLMEIINHIHSRFPYTELVAEYFPKGWIHIGLLKGNINRELKLTDEKHYNERIHISKLAGLYGR